VIKFERQQFILEQLGAKASVALRDLVAQTGATRLTIQRDLFELETQHKLKRVHGGATALPQLPQGLPQSFRQQQNTDAKRRLCRHAASLLENGDAIGIDASTTCFFIGDYVAERLLNAVTVSHDTFVGLSRNVNVTAFLSGGTYNARTQTISGSYAVEFIRRFAFAKCFISADALSERGSLDWDADDSAVKRAMIECSQSVYLLFDSSKFEQSNGLLTCAPERITAIISDAPAPGHWPLQLQRKTIVAV